MTRTILRTISLSALLLFCTASLVQAKALDAVLHQKNSIVSVYVNKRDGTHVDAGTGFIVDPDGIIVTDCRLIARWITEAGARLSVETEGAGTFPVEDVISSKCENNLALVGIKAADLPAVKSARAVQFHQGEEMMLLRRRPGSGPVIWSVGVRGLSDKGRSFQIPGNLAQEESGSPLFNVKGDVVGAVIVQRRKGKYFTFGVRMGDILLKQLAKYRKPSMPVKRSIGLPPKEEEKKPVEKKPEEEKPIDFREYFTRGCSYDNLGMYKEAIKEYRQSLAVNPSFSESYINLGVDYYKMGKYDAAIDVFKKVIEVKPDLLSAYNKLAATYIIRGDYSMAIAILSKAIELDPHNPAAHFNRGIAYFLSGNMAAAIGECTVLKDIDKAKADSLNDLLY